MKNTLNNTLVANLLICLIYSCSKLTPTTKPTDPIAQKDQQNTLPKQETPKEKAARKEKEKEKEKEKFYNDVIVKKLEFTTEIQSLNSMFESETTDTINRIDYDYGNNTTNSQKIPNEFEEKINNKKIAESADDAINNAVKTERETFEKAKESTKNRLLQFEKNYRKIQSINGEPQVKDGLKKIYNYKEYLASRDISITDSLKSNLRRINAATNVPLSPALSNLLLESIDNEKFPTSYAIEEFSKSSNEDLLRIIFNVYKNKKFPIHASRFIKDIINEKEILSYTPEQLQELIFPESLNEQIKPITERLNELKNKAK